MNYLFFRFVVMLQLVMTLNGFAKLTNTSGAYLNNANNASSQSDFFDLPENSKKYINLISEFITFFNDEKFEIIFKDNYSEAKFPIKFEIIRSSEFNLEALYDNQNNPIIRIHSQILEHHLINEPVLIQLLCHELGHFIGGNPKKKKANGSSSWSTIEGQADLFSSGYCLPLFYEHHQNLVKQFLSTFTDDLKISENELSQIIKTQNGAVLSQHKKVASTNSSSSNESEVSRLILNSSWQLTHLFAQINKDPFKLNLFQKDFYRTKRIVENHASAQCRLDTFINGFNCHGLYQTDNLLTENLELFNQCSEEKLDLGIEIRPRCWWTINQKK